MFTLHNGDCAEVMASMEANSVDAIVTDPPYGLAFMGAKWDSFNGGSGSQTISDRQAEGKRYAQENKGAPRYGNSHGKRVTHDEMVSFQERMTPIFEEALRVAKPGAHMLCFGGTRTFHRLTCAIEDAGWEIRDCIMWTYGSGFPKSMDVAKAIDKASGYVGKVIGTRTVDVDMQGNHMHAGRKTELREQELHEHGDAAKEWDGWGTCLKPAWEPIIVARKPLDGTVAHNVMTYGTGAINIDGCRVPTGDNVYTHGDGDEVHRDVYAGRYKAIKPRKTNGQELGRFPANLVHDGSQMVLELFPDSKGQQARVAGNEPSRTGDNGIYGHYGQRNEFVPRGDSGSAARFFYCAKASKKDRGEGNDHPTVKPNSLMRWLVRLVCPQGGVVLDPFMGSGSTGVACVDEGMLFIGIDLDPHYCEIADRRMSNEYGVVFDET